MCRPPTCGATRADELYGVALADALECGVACLTGPEHPGVIDPRFYARLAGDLCRNHVTVLADLTGPALPAALSAGVSVLKLSASELVEEGGPRTTASRRSRPRCSGCTSRVRASRSHHAAPSRRSPCREGRLFRLRGPHLTAADPTGTGDAMLAATAVSLAGGHETMDAIVFGSPRRHQCDPSRARQRHAAPGRAARATTSPCEPLEPTPDRSGRRTPEAGMSRRSPPPRLRHAACSRSSAPSRRDRGSCVRDGPTSARWWPRATATSRPAVDLQVENAVKQAPPGARAARSRSSARRAAAARSPPARYGCSIRSTARSTSPAAARSAASRSRSSRRAVRDSPIVDFPFLEERYLAAEGAGASSERPTDTLRPRSSALHDTVVGMSDFSVGHDAPTENPLHLAIAQRAARRALRVRLHGSEALDLAWTAAGRLGATIMLSNLPWDVSGGILLVREAGGEVFDLDGPRTRHGHSARSPAVPVSAGPCSSSSAEAPTPRPTSPATADTAFEIGCRSSAVSAW